MEESDEKQWFAMRATYRRELSAQRSLEARSVETFIPMCRRIRRIGTRKVRELVPAVHNLIFVHERGSVLQTLKAGIPFLQYMVDGGGRKIVVPHEEMGRFIAATQSCNEHLIYLRPEEIDLARGTRVRIHGGPFDGQEGVFVRVKGARDRRVVVAVEGVIAVALATIHPDLLEVISDTENLKRQTK